MSRELRSARNQFKKYTCGARLMPANIQFLDDWVLAFSPYNVSESSLVDLCVHIVRVQYEKGQLGLSPQELSKLLDRAINLDMSKRSRMARLLADAAKINQRLE